MDLLDIGGGFPGSDDGELQFEEVSCIFFVCGLSKAKCVYLDFGIRQSLL